MKINEILVESQLQEGPILNKIGSAVGKGVGTLAKGVGAVAGGIAGLGGAIKKGFQAGKATVGGAGDDEEPAAGSEAPASTPAAGGGAPAAKTATTSAPAAKTAAASAPAADSEAPTSTAAPAAKKAAAAPAAEPAANPRADTAYAQAQKAIAGLQPEQKKEIVTMLQADPKVKAAMTAKPAAKTATKPAAPAGAGAMGAMAGQLAKGGAAEPNTMANAPVSKTNTAKPGNPNAAPAAEPKSGMTQDDQPHWDPKTGKGAKYDGVTGKATPGWQAELDKKSAASAPPANPLADTPPASKPAPTTTGKAAANADATGGDPEKAALDAMKSKNPKLAGMMAQAGMDDQGNDVPKKKGRQKAAPKPSQAEIDASRERIMGPTSDSIIRTRPMMAEGFSLFRKR